MAKLPEQPSSPKVVSIDSRQPPWDPEAYVREWHAFLESVSTARTSKQTLEEKARELNSRNWFEYRHRRLLAEFLALEWSEVPEVRKVVLFGQVAQPLTKEPARAPALRKRGVEVWRACPTVQMALWIGSRGCLPALYKHRNAALDMVISITEMGIAIAAIEMYLFDQASGVPLGRAVRDGGLVPVPLPENALAPDQSILLLDQARPETKYRLRDRLSPAVSAALHILQGQTQKTGRKDGPPV